MLALELGDQIPEQVKSWLRADQTTVNKWREEAKKDFDFRDGDQWSEDDKNIMEGMGRALIVMNRCGVVVDAVCGAEIANRQEVRYIPRETSRQKQQRLQNTAAAIGDFSPDVVSSEIYTEAARWFRDRADADENDTEAFRDAVTCGIGCTETRLDYEENPDGDLRDDHTDIFEMLWDGNARKRNLRDAQRIWHIKKLPLVEARALIKREDGEDYSDEELHASWAENAIWTGQETQHDSEPVRDRTGPGDMKDPDQEMDEVVLVRMMWIEREPIWRVVTPEGSVNMTKADLAKIEVTEGADAVKAIKEAAVQQSRKVRKQAWLGNVVLKTMPTPCPTQFPFQFITAKRHQNKRMWYGIVRTMRDPQEWSNKLFSQILDIINSSAKGGIMAERGAFFENDNEAEESWTSTRDITWVKAGALNQGNPKFANKPQASFPNGLQYLLEVATSSIRDTVGVSLEMLGMREGDQAGILEYQRRQSGMTILQPFFDSLKSYRRDQGELILWYIQNDLSDGRLIRVVGEDNAPYVQLIKGATLEYDLIIDDMPTSPNQKEMIAQVVMQLLPIIKEIAPDLVPDLLKFLPLPSSLSSKLDKLIEQKTKGPMAQLQEKMVMLEAAMAELKVKGEAADIGKTMADTQKTQAETAKIASEAGAGSEDPRIKTALAVRKQDIDAGIQTKRVEGDLAIRAANFQADNERADRKQALDMEIAGAAADNKADLETWKATEKAVLDREMAEMRENANERL